MADTLLLEHWNEFGVSSPRDAIIACLHAVLLSEGFAHPSTGEKQQLLPAGWNSSQELYIVHYEFDSNKYLVKALAMDDQLVINVLSPENQKVYTSYVDTKEHIDLESQYSYPRVFKRFSQLCTQLKYEIVHKLKPPTQVSDSVHAGPPSRPRPTQSHVTPDPLMVGGPRLPDRHGDLSGPRVPHHHDPLREPNPFSVGEGDRLPFGGVGGMLMDPFRQGRMPQLPQGVPPGARFDPFTPFHPAIPRGPRPPGHHPYGPDNDHLPPPGYDDMFM